MDSLAQQQLHGGWMVTLAWVGCGLLARLGVGLACVASVSAC